MAMNDQSDPKWESNLHVAEFYKLIDQCGPDLQKLIYSTCCSVLDPPNSSVSDIAPRPEDDVLTAANKMRSMEGKKVGDIVGWTGTTREDMEKSLLKLAPSGISLDFVITSLVKMLDDSFRIQGDVDIEVKLEQMRSSIPHFELKRDNDSPENADRWNQMITFANQQIDEMPGRILERQAEYSEWRKVFGQRVDSPTMWGRWDDIVAEAMKNWKNPLF
jgi:hypothetical protein